MDLLDWIPDKIYLQITYRLKFGHKLNLKNPKTFNEKLQWLKLYDRKPIYSTMVDKCEAKKYVASILGEEYIIPTLGVWDRFDDIDFDSLPDQFVLKCTHDSGGLVICC
ncbi:MAG: glycosyl transferase, partial [Bacteroides thetaiotaomicron]|nr:glycosyl transferase [Bacteroides thetaiotaomicron]